MIRFVPRVFRWAALLPGLALTAEVYAQNPTPSLVDRHLAVRTAATGLEQPIHVAFLGSGDMLVLEKGTGRVRRVVNGVVTATVLDLPVNSASERGLLSIALHPDFELLFIVIPVKVKWLALFTWIMLALRLWAASNDTRGAILVSLANYFLFFGRRHVLYVIEWIQGIRHKRRFRQWNP